MPFFSSPLACVNILWIRVHGSRPDLTFRLVKPSAFVFILAFGAGAVAATIQGVVRDPSGAVVAKAEVTVSGAALSAPRAAQTDAQGRFSIDGLAPGDFQVRVRAPGFEQFQNSVTISQQPAVEFNIQLTIQAQESSVEVGGKRSALANSDPNYRALRDSGLAEVFNVENAVLRRDLGELRLKSGVVAFLPPVLGHVAMGVFVGQGSLHFAPAFPLEASYFKMLTDETAMDEEFDTAVLCFTDGTYQELKSAGFGTPSKSGVEEALRAFRSRMRQRIEHPESMLQAMLLDEDIPNVEAELAAELYNPHSAPSFAAYLHGRRYRDLRFLIAPRGAMRHMPSPEEGGTHQHRSRGKARCDSLSEPYGCGVSGSNRQLGGGQAHRDGEALPHRNCNRQEWAPHRQRGSDLRSTARR